MVANPALKTQTGPLCKAYCINAGNYFHFSLVQKRLFIYVLFNICLTLKRDVIEDKPESDFCWAWSASGAHRPK
jgi:hypothetical protein